MTLTVAATAIMAATASAVTITIGFESETQNAFVPEPFTSADSSAVHFSDTLGDDLFIGADPDGGNVLAILFDDSSALLIELDFLANAISLDVGNPGQATKAVLKAFLNGALVGSSELGLNGTVNLDQTIAFSGLTFDSATLAFAMPNLATELVDNIHISAIPEPSAALVFGTGFVIFGTALRPLGRAKRRRVEGLR